MLIFVLNVKNELSGNVIKPLLASLFELEVRAVSELGESIHETHIAYYLKIRIPPTEFSYELIINVSEELALNSEVYNSLQIAKPLSKLIDNEVVIHDQSNDPSRWILVNQNNQIFIANEIDYDNDKDGFIIDRRNLNEITEAVALQVLPSREYVLLSQEDRPIFYNRNPPYGE